MTFERPSPHRPSVPYGKAVFSSTPENPIEPVPEKYRDKQDWWFAYECCHGDCPETQDGRTGLVLDVRISDPNGDRREPEIPCPSCKRPMHFRGRWHACSNGYGSRGSPCGGAKGENHIEDLEEGC